MPGRPFTSTRATSAPSGMVGHSAVSSRITLAAPTTGRSAAFASPPPSDRTVTSARSNATRASVSPAENAASSASSNRRCSAGSASRRAGPPESRRLIRRLATEPSRRSATVVTTWE